jgi:hypothetical protein
MIDKKPTPSQDSSPNSVGGGNSVQAKSAVSNFQTTHADGNRNFQKASSGNSPNAPLGTKSFGTTHSNQASPPEQKASGAGSPSSTRRASVMVKAEKSGVSPPTQQKAFTSSSASPNSNFRRSTVMVPTSPLELTKKSIAADGAAPRRMSIGVVLANTSGIGSTKFAATKTAGLPTKSPVASSAAPVPPGSSSPGQRRQSLHVGSSAGGNPTLQSTTTPKETSMPARRQSLNPAMSSISLLSDTNKLGGVAAPAKLGGQQQANATPQSSGNSNMPARRQSLNPAMANLGKKKSMIG